MVLQNDVDGEWVSQQIVANQEVRVSANGLIGLDVGEDYGWNSKDVKAVSTGDYRVHVSFEVMGEIFESSWEFNVSETTVKCTDTDNGTTPSEYGTVVDSYGAYDDYCLDSGTVVEGICSLDGYISKNIICKDGVCRDGACSVGIVKSVSVEGEAYAVYPVVRK